MLKSFLIFPSLICLEPAEGLEKCCYVRLTNYAFNVFFTVLPCILMLSRPLFFIYIFIYFLWRCGPTRVMVSSFLRFLDHTQRCITVRRTPLDEWSVHRRPTHNTHNRHIHAPGGIRTHNPSKRTAVDLRLRPRDHWDRHIFYLSNWMHNLSVLQSC